METNFTPGPWCYAGSELTPSRISVYAYGPLCYVDKLADARLISAAPDLLTALQRLVHPMADDTDLENARDVIARATGAAAKPLYMNPNTGSVDTLDGWESTDGLVQVRRDENGDWVEA